MRVDEPVAGVPDNHSSVAVDDGCFQQHGGSAGAVVYLNRGADGDIIDQHLSDASFNNDAGVPHRVSYQRSPHRSRLLPGG